MTIVWRQKLRSSEHFLAKSYHCKNYNKQQLKWPAILLIIEHALGNQMTQQRFGFFFVFILPALIVIMISLTFDWLKNTNQVYQAQVQTIPYLAAVLAFVLALQYYQFKTFFAALILLLAYLSFWQLLHGSNSSPLGIYWGLSIIFSMQWLWLSFSQPSNPVSLKGLTTAILLALPYLILMADGNSLLLGQLIQSLPKSWRQDIINGVWISPMALMIFLPTLAAVSYRSFKERSLIAGSMFICLLAIFTALVWLQRPLYGVTFFVGASLTLVVSLFIESWAQAYRDELTGLASRRALMSRLHSLSGRYSLAVIDVDNFKVFNDRYGHDTGDDVLRIVAQQLGKVGPRNKAYRFGGEEFVILMPGKHLDDAHQLMDQLRKRIANYPVVIRDRVRRPNQDVQGIEQRGLVSVKRTIHITVSIGIAQPDARNLKPASVFKLADEALYRAKAQGRNQVVS